MNDNDLEALLSLDGASFEMAEGYIIEFEAKRVEPTPAKPHGLDYALVFRQKDGKPCVRFDNSHSVRRRGGRYVKRSLAYDHWHRDERDKGRPYAYSSAVKLLEDFWREVKRVLDKKGIPNDLP